MFPMHKETGKGFGHIHQPVISIGSRPLPKPSIPISNPMSKTEVKITKQIPHFSFPELTIVVNPSSGLCFQDFRNFINRKLCPSVDFEFKENLIDPLLTFHTDSREKPIHSTPRALTIRGLNVYPRKSKDLFTNFIGTCRF